MYTLRNAMSHDHVLAQSPDLSTILLVKLWNEYHYDVKTVIFDSDGDLVNRDTLARHAYQVELSVRPR